MQIDPALANAIIESLANSINPDNAKRAQAEATLKEAQKQNGFASALLKISGYVSLNQRQFEH